MFNDLFKDLSNESYAEEYAHLEEVTANDLIIEDMQEGSISNGITEVIKGETIADNLEDIADRADDLDDVTDVESLESLHREFEIIMTAHNLNFKATSFESASNFDDAKMALSRDARDVSNLIRTRMDELNDFSTESFFGNLFKNKDTKFADALALVQKSANEIKGGKQKDSFEIKHSGLATFLTRVGKPVKDIPGDIKSCVDKLLDLGSVLPGITSEISKIASSGKDFDQDKLIVDFNNKLPFDFMGSTLVDKSNDRAFSLYKPTESNVLKKFASIVILFGGAVAITNQIDSKFKQDTTSRKIAAGAAGAALGFGVHVASNKISEMSGERGQITDKDLDKIVSSILKLKVLRDDLKKGENTLKGIGKSIKTIEDKTVAKKVKKSLSIVISQHSVVQELGFYMAVNTAKLLELTASRLSKSK